MMTNNAPAPIGLNSRAAAERLLKDGYNELPATKPRNIVAIAWKVVSEPMLLLLIACGSIYLILGDRQEALVLLGFVMVIIGITLFQEHKTERALEALRDLSSPRALVIRDGVQSRIAGRDVVRGDILLLSEGDRVPADAVLLSCMNMTVDESLLTGESAPVSKAVSYAGSDIGSKSNKQTMGQADGDGQATVFSGSLVVQGKGMAEVIATGTYTQIGKIGKALFSVRQEPTRMQRETARVVKVVATAALLLAAFLAIWYGVTRNEWLGGLLVGITFAMAVIPEELPVVLTLFLGIGAWRISRLRVLTRRVPAIETLGSTTVLCVDKTGTLTQNHMAVAQIFTTENSGKHMRCDATMGSLPEEFHAVLEYAILASHRDPFDPMEMAIQEAGLAVLGHTEHLHDSWALVSEYPLSKELLAMSRVWQSKDLAHFVIASKGAPEAIGDLCHLSAQQMSELASQVNLMAEQGLRVLGVAKAIFNAKAEPSASAMPAIQHDFDFEFLGLIGLADPIRPEVPAAIKECQGAGIRVVMVTGDYPATAINIAAQCGLFSAGGVMSGADISASDDAQLQRRIRDINIFCRVAPEQKLRLVNLLKNDGEIVAMTGDGVNDAPALKAAHIGVAMGKRGTDVARESAALVLLDDDFASIVTAIKQGRRIFDNLRKTISFIIAAHIPVIGMSLIPVMMGWPVVLMPVHILVLQLIIDPTCSLVFEAEAEERDVMQRPPRPTDASIFEFKLLNAALLQGGAILATVLGTLLIARQTGMGDDQARALAFASMVLGNIGLIFINRSLSGDVFKSIALPNPALWLVCVSALLILAASLLVPALNTVFYFARLDAMPLALTAAATMACITLLIWTKSRARRHSP